MRTPHLHRDRLDARILEHRPGDALGQPLEQREPFPGDHPLHHRRQRAVVDGVVEVVAASSDRQVGVDVEVDLERLGAHLLVGQRAVYTEDAQAA